MLAKNFPNGVYPLKPDPCHKRYSIKINKLELKNAFQQKKNGNYFYFK